MLIELIKKPKVKGPEYCYSFNKKVVQKKFLGCDSLKRFVCFPCLLFAKVKIIVRRFVTLASRN